MLDYLRKLICRICFARLGFFGKTAPAAKILVSRPSVLSALDSKLWLDISLLCDGNTGPVLRILLPTTMQAIAKSSSREGPRDSLALTQDEEQSMPRPNLVDPAQ